MDADVELDCKGLSCPMPMVKMAKAMKKMKSGEVLAMAGTDPGSKKDVPTWCDRGGHELLDTVDSGEGVTTFYIKKA